MNFLEKIESFESNVCLFDENKKNFSYKNILMKSETLGKNLKSRSLIFVLAENHIEFFTSYISFFRKQ